MGSSNQSQHTGIYKYAGLTAIIATIIIGAVFLGALYVAAHAHH